MISIERTPDQKNPAQSPTNLKTGVVEKPEPVTSVLRVQDRMISMVNVLDQINPGLNLTKMKATVAGTPDQIPQGPNLPDQKAIAVERKEVKPWISTIREDKDKTLTYHPLRELCR